MAENGSEKNGSGGGDPFDHNDLETLGHALREGGRGLVSFGAEYKYLDAAEREIRRQRTGRLVALINSLWSAMDAEIKADERPPITNHERDARMYHVDRLFNMMEAVAKKPPEDD